MFSAKIRKNMKIAIFTDMKNRSLLHGRVILMSSQLLVRKSLEYHPPSTKDHYPAVYTSGHEVMIFLKFNFIINWSLNLIYFS